VGSSSFDVSVSFNVDGSGNVTSLNPVAATASGNVLTFNNATVTFNTGSYGGRYFLSSYFPQAFTGTQSIVLVPGLTYTLDNGTELPGSSFAFNVNSDGTVTSSSPSATATAATLTFQTAAVSIDPGNYVGTYFLTCYFPNLVSGRQTFQLIAGLSVEWDNTSNLGTSAFLFTVGVDGTVSVPAGSPAVGNGSTLQLQTVQVTINPAGYSGTYTVSDSHTATYTGTTTLALVPGTYTISTAAGAGIAFNVDGSGSVTILNGTSADGTGGAGQITFGTNLGGGDPATTFPATLNIDNSNQAFTASAFFDDGAYVAGFDAASPPQAAVLGLGFACCPTKFTNVVRGKKGGFGGATGSLGDGVGHATMGFDNLFNALHGITPKTTYEGGWRLGCKGTISTGGPFLVNGELRIGGHHTVGTPSQPVVIVVRPTARQLEHGHAVTLTGDSSFTGVIFVDLRGITASTLVLKHDLVRVEGHATMKGLIAIEGPQGALQIGERRHDDHDRLCDRDHDRFFDHDGDDDASVWTVRDQGSVHGSSILRLHGAVAGDLPCVTATGHGEVEFDSTCCGMALKTLGTR
jgi:hypothetical protein